MDKTNEVVAAQREFRENESNIAHAGGEQYAIDLIVEALAKNKEKFDITIDKVPKKYLYTDKVIPVVYKFYIERNLDENAFIFIHDAHKYHLENGLTFSRAMEDILLRAPDERLLERLKTVLANLRDLPPSDIPKVLPKILNKKYRLNEFILLELLTGLRIMRKKIKAVEQIIHEDCFNDVLLATLRLRLPVWGWDIDDQARSGESWAGKNAGEIDITFKAAGNDIALVEALKMDGGDLPNLQKHVLKVGQYSRDLKTYYMIVYYHGDRSKFAGFWTTYQADIARITYNTTWTYNTTPGFEDITDQYEDIEHIFVGRSQHGSSKTELFHIVIDMSKK